MAELAIALYHAKTEYVREDRLADLYLAFGDQERAIQWMQKAAASNSAHLAFWASDPTLSVRSDPRVQAILKRVKLR